MPRKDQTTPADLPDQAIWQLSRDTEITPDEAARWLDLAGFADARLDEDDSERVAAGLAADADAAADIAAVREVQAESEPAAERIVARALALVEPRGAVIAFPRPVRTRVAVYRAARWGSVAAALALASWLGFALGADASMQYGRIAQSVDEGNIGDMLDPSANTLRNTVEGLDS